MKKLYLLFLLFLAALNFNLILKPLNIVVGGTQGLALIINHIMNIPNYIIILIINIIMFVISCLFLNKDVTKSIIIASFIYPLFIKITSNIFLDINPWLLVIISGVVSGISGGFILKLGYSSGGINILIILLKKYLSIKESLSNLLINLTIIMLGSYYLGNTLYAIIIIFINSIIINFIM